MHDMNKNSAYGLIPQFALYGEPNSSQNVEFVHIEDIADRSSKNAWLIKPHRHTKLFQVLCMFEGGVSVQLDEESYSLSGSCAIVIPAGVVHGFHFLPETQGLVLSLAEPQYSKHHLNAMSRQASIMDLNESGVVLAQLQQYLSLIKAEFQRTEADYEQALEALVTLTLTTLKRQFDKLQMQNSQTDTASLLLSKFRALLEKNYRQQWSVQEYCAALHTSISTLNRLCHEMLGLTAKVIIQDRVLIEAKRRLIYTEDSLDQVAYTLGFKDPAYFSRFFKKLEGLPPSEYRKLKNK